MDTVERLEILVRQGVPDLHHLELQNESHQHSGPATDSHFRLVVVSDAFAGQRPVARHQTIYALVRELMPTPVHALALHTFTVAEWQARGGQAATSPNCRGGSAADPLRQA